ncbi:ATP-binding cassette domain-containing protein, partial [Pseudonocardia sp.]|uniref:ATP-binding cassette domain-containing protein n=1 Tax=Pseudonocardia sp. TaxID=60912 RepID=UPI0031FCF2F5
LSCANTVLVAAGVGSVVGIARRRGWGYLRTAAVAAAGLGLPAAALALGGLWLFAGYRELAFAQLVSGSQGVTRLLAGIGLPALARFVDLTVGWAVAYWAIWIPAVIVGAAGTHVGFVRLLLSAPLRALDRLRPASLSTLPSAGPAGARVAPLPVRLRQVSFRYPGSAHQVVSGLDLDLAGGEFVTLVGPNGAGKSTLGRLLAGAPPDEGEVVRPGAAGLGVPGGTGMIFQRPDSQVLGVRVVDDLLWGVPSTTPVDVDALLERVGLAGLAERETATLSGGQLQRLAVAALLARRPSLVISDESTAMLDSEGRARMLALLRSLAAEEGRAVLHITHHREELLGSDRTVMVGPIRGDADPPEPPGMVSAARSLGGGALLARGLGFVYAPATPWEHRVLDSVDLDLPAGGGLLVTGANGSGKSTLAAILAGLAAPTEGVALVDGRPVRNGPDGALLGLQHPRLQLVRPTVGQDIQDAAGVGPEEADAALATLGLSPERYRDRRIDELSVGEQRRVALGGLLACHPRVLVLDEPLAWLDQPGCVALLRALRAVRDTGTTMVLTAHDTEGLDGLVDAAVLVADGRVRTVASSTAAASPPPLTREPPSPTAEPPSPTAEAPPGTVRARRQPSTGFIPRTLPWSTPAHRLWAGTKIAVLGCVVLALAARPTWAALGAAVVVLGAWAGVARLPRCALPRVPLWFALATAASGVLVALGGGLDGLLHWVLFTGITALSLFGALLLIWTTPLADIPPLLQQLAQLGRRTRLPVIEWASAVSLGLRLLPILQAECRTVLLTATQRATSAPDRKRIWRDRRRKANRAILLCCATALRRATEMGEAITARGGLGQIARIDHKPGRRDLLVFAAALAILVAGCLI